MKYILIFLFILLLICGVVWYYSKDKSEGAVVITDSKNMPEIVKNKSEDVIIKAMNLSSSKFENGGLIPQTYTCDGKNIMPPLSISNVPSNAKSLVLIMDDHDVPKTVRADGIWDHLVVFNISTSTREIKEGEKISGTYGKNTSGTNKYGGPCPPDREHAYTFYLYAIDTELPLGSDATKNAVLDAISGHIIEEARLVGRYDRAR